MSKKVKVASITIEYPDGDIKELSVENARELYRQLNELFGVPAISLPPGPIIIERERWPRWREPFTVNSPHTQPATFSPSPIENPRIWCSAARTE